MSRRTDKLALHLPLSGKERGAESLTLGNGLRVLILRRGSLPLAALRMTLPAGSAADPPGKAGLADFCANLLRRGTRRWSADGLDEAIEFRGGSLVAGATEDYLFIHATMPSEHLAAMLEVVAELVRRPTFPVQEVESARTRLVAQLDNDLDQPPVVASHAVPRALWGEEHPYGHDVVGSARNAKTFARADLQRFHRRQFAPDRGSLVIVGAGIPSSSRLAVQRAFGSWKRGGPQPPPLRARERPAMAGRALIIHQPDLTQSQIRIAGMGFPKRHPDFFPAEVMNAILGGIFTSRLMQAIRVDRGLSYGASSHFDSLLAGGSFVASTYTKTETTGEAIDVALAEMIRLSQRGPTGAETEAARNYLAGVYPLQLETNDSLAAAIAEVEFYGLGSDWIDRYRQRLREVTPKQVKEMARRYLRPKEFALVLVGNAPRVRAQVRSLAPATVVPISKFQ